MNAAPGDKHLPFPRSEYTERIAKVRRAMAGAKIDLLFLTSPPNLTWLTGYDSMWYGHNIPTALAVSAERTVFFDASYHERLVETSMTNVDEAVWISDAGGRPDGLAIHVAAVRDVLKALRTQDLLRGTVAIEQWTPIPPKPVLDALEEAFTEAGCRVCDGSWLVDHERLVKSPKEIQIIRKAARIGDAGMRAVAESLQPGLSEKEIEGIAHHAMTRLGGEPAAIRTHVRAGAKRGDIHHGLPTDYCVRKGDLVVIDFCASYFRYHVDIQRTFAVGEVDSRWSEVLERAAGSIEEVQRQLRPGDDGARLAEICGNYLAKIGLQDNIWFAGGYDLGIGIPPDWVGHYWWGAPGFATLVYHPGTVSNYENVFDVGDASWGGGSSATYIETILMTESGLEILSGFPRTLTVV